MQGKSRLEGFKEQGRRLRGEIAGGLEDDRDHFDEADKQLLKFHGLYQQDDRDRRAEARRRGEPKRHSFMVRSKIPGGRLSAEQYVVHDDLATSHGNGTLRITTRQDLQLHGVLKGDLRRSLRELDAALVTTWGACGDVVRNVMCCPAPGNEPLPREIESHARRLSDAFLPRSRAYHEIWLDGERVGRGERRAASGPEDEPIYGPTYLPRKFKIALARDGDNCVDVHTQDVGLVAIGRERLRGFVVLVGGGLGMTHRKPATFPRLADPLAFVPPARLVEVVRRIVETQRDHGDRNDRRHARLKYLIHDRGLDWFRTEVERRLGWRLAAPEELPPMDLRLHLGWHRQDSDHWFLGIPVENGRIVDRGELRLRSGLRRAVESQHLEVRLTPQQDLLLAGIHDEARERVQRILDDHGISRVEDLSPLRTLSMACPALPTCGLALAEAERVLPAVIDRLERDLRQLGLERDRWTVRMTGCPNGCARPYVADLAFVGRTLGRYAILVGGRSDGTRLNQVYRDLVPLEHLADEVAPLLRHYRDTRRPGESFGDYCNRLGVELLRRLARAPHGAVAHG